MASECFNIKNTAYKITWAITYPSFQFNNPRDDEITVSISSHVMNLKVIKKSSQIYSMKQQPSVHIKMPGRYGISSPFSIGNICHFSINWLQNNMCILDVIIHKNNIFKRTVQIHNEEEVGGKSFLVLRTSKIVEIVSTASTEKVW